MTTKVWKWESVCEKVKVWKWKCESVCEKVKVWKWKCESVKVWKGLWESVQAVEKWAMVGEVGPFGAKPEQLNIRNIYKALSEIYI